MSVVGRLTDAACREDEFIGIVGEGEIPGVAAHRNQNRLQTPPLFRLVVRRNRAYHIGRSVGIFLPSAYGPYY